ncbi:MAG TPA: type ISP restriction/modification enzyme [Candidatus Saccharimonadales bacterium]|nr:type ISP restriction/modification enzyme [Candidatus Saccharimonadales bacterium]
MTFNEILHKYRDISSSERDKGDRFERLMQSYLLTEPLYRNKFTKVWMWNDFPGRKDLGSKDTGIDLVAKTFDGEYWAIQCKCYQDTTYIDKPHVDSFLSTSSRKFHDDKQDLVGFSNRLWISTTNKWSNNASGALENQHPPVSRINLYDLQEAPIDWGALEKGIVGDKSLLSKRDLLPHQRTALDTTLEYFKSNDRGKMIMACGTGKTFTSLKIAESQTDSSGFVLFLVPSIALLGQTLREWSTFAKEPFNAICICSDPKITKKRQFYDESNISTLDLAIPASTDVANIDAQLLNIQKAQKPGMTVVFSTYQSIDVISRTLEGMRDNKRFKSFDLIICDEAHRTTGVTLAEEDKSSFVKVHYDNFIPAKKRLYMTATPRLYGDEAKSKADRNNAVICSMDDEKLYGKEIYRIGFGEAVEKDLLSDYKVLILTLREDDVSETAQKILTNQDNEINVNDVSKLIGSINALSKQILGDKGLIKENDPDPMRRSVAFCQSIAASKTISGTFNIAGEEYIKTQPKLKRDQLVDIYSKHIDGTMSAPERDDLMGWLKGEMDNPRESRVLTNVRCLSEGVDVPSLDAVLFLSAKNSQVDVVQSVGRVMRKAEGKKYGYIIIPVVVPSDVDPNAALDDNERYKVVWSVLNALRAHDDRFNATINKIDLNKNRPEQIIVGKPDPTGEGEEAKEKKEDNEKPKQIKFPFDELQNAIYAKMVLKVGERGYWEQWAASVADIAERQIRRITKIVEEDDNAHMAMREFIRGLQKNINPSITEHQAIEMLSQHIITKPVFEALFEGYSFVQNNAVSVSMQKALDAIEAQAIEGVDAESLQDFYKSVRQRAEGIDNSAGKQRIVAELYEKFFKTAFPQMVEQLGIVYTPPEVVDFIIHSVNDVLQKEFSRNLSDENVNILDPFTGTGTFITRLLQTGVIKREDLERKYKHEIFANEIVLLAYYIAAVNIENAYHDLLEKDKYESFEGIVLTDTFQLSEDDGNTKLFSDALAENSERLQRQKNTPLRVIIGNPPYSVGQKSENDNAKNQKYPKLDRRISETYSAASTAGLNKALYDAYIKAFRWSSDRLGADGGVISFVSNGSWLEGNAASGLRKSLENEFSSIHVFNLRGNARTSGELRRKEAGNVFKDGSRTPISITVLVRNPNVVAEKASIYYHDIGDYLNRERKLEIIKEYKSILNPDFSLQKLEPNEHGDWLNQRNSLFSSFIPLKPEKGIINTISVFDHSSLGLLTARDSWTYNFSTKSLVNNVSVLLDFYNQQRVYLNTKHPNADPKNFIDYDSKKISWTHNLINDLKRNIEISFNKESIVAGLYRPFVKQHVYFSRSLNERVYQTPKYFPSPDVENLVIIISGVAASKEFSVLISDLLPNYHALDTDQIFPLYYYEENEEDKLNLFPNQKDTGFIKREGISDSIHKLATVKYGNNVAKEDIFYYVYGLLHSPDYRKMFVNDLKKMLPRLPLVESASDFWAFSNAGRKAANLHINYEKVSGYEAVKVSGIQEKNFRVKKMRFATKSKDTIIFNNNIKVENIPEKAYEYIINGKSAIECILERYQLTINKDSGIVNDPNEWANEVGNPRYILDLLLSIINVSIQTVDIVNSLPRVIFNSSENL